MPIQYLALGDSYTIGTGATDAAHNFPSLLARVLEERTRVPVLVENPAVNGYTTSDLIRRELPQVTQPPQLASVLIGANDIVQGSDEAVYRRNLQAIYAFVHGFGLAPGCAIAISIPDFSIVPGAAPYGSPQHLGARIEAFNRIARPEAQAHGFQWIDVSDLSRSGLDRSDWIAEDQLHPADAQYRAWADFIWPRVEAAWTRAASA
jgi:acyl-CoA thioesterase I